LFFSGGDGNDTLEVGGLFAGNLTFLGDAGADNLIIGVQADGQPSGGGGSTILFSGGAGDDSVLLSGTSGELRGASVEGTFQLGDGNDTFLVSSLFAGNLAIFGGAGDDFVGVAARSLCLRMGAEWETGGCCGYPRRRQRHLGGQWVVRWGPDRLRRRG
jgi:hypothetical protein